MPSLRRSSRFQALSKCASGALLASLVALTAVGCSSSTDDDAARDDATKKASSSLKLCAAVRGNGHYIMTHFTSLARIVEHYGVIDGLAGGSSGSITQFLYESMHMNPDLRTCGAGKCTDEQTAARLALLLKSVMGYAEAVGGSDEAQSIMALVSSFSKVKADFDAKGIAALASSDANAAAVEIKKILENDDLKALVNPDVFEMLKDTEHLSFNVKEIVASVQTITAFSAVENRIFFRTGVINFVDLANKMGRVADFYAGRAQTNEHGIRDFLDACATDSVGKQWAAVKELPANGASCGAMFNGLVKQYRLELPSKAGTYTPRVSENVSSYAAVTKVVSTSVVTGETLANYRTALTEYQKGAHPEGNVPFAAKWSDVKFGYWSSDATLKKIASNEKGYKDAKTLNFEPLGDAKWLDVLAASPAEPGLSRFVEVPGGKVSAGGWSDLAPVLVLKNAGCENVIYITRETDESDFASGIAKHLGMGTTEFKEIFDLANVETTSNVGSGFANSVAKAEGVWCTNWNSFTDFQTVQMSEHAYGGPAPAMPLEAHDAYFQKGAFGTVYPNVVTNSGKVGCTPGLSGGAKLP